MAQRDYSARREGSHGDDYGFGQPQGGQQHGGLSGGQRSDAGSNYGDFRRDQQQQYSDRGRQAGDYYTGGNRGVGQQGGFDSPYPGYGGQQGGYGQSDFPTSQDYRSSEGDAGGYGRAGGRGGNDWQRSQDLYGTQGQEARGYGQYGHQGHSGQQGRDHFDPDYHQWRSEQLRTLDNDYRQWREERYKKFSDEFDTWRKGRSGAQGASAGGSTQSDSRNTPSGSTTGSSDLPGSSGITSAGRTK